MEVQLKKHLDLFDFPNIIQMTVSYELIKQLFPCFNVAR